MNQAIVGVGSNIAPRENIARARALLARDHELVAESSYITTAAIDRPDDPDFLNGALCVDTPLDQHAFRAYLKEIERQLGRVKTADPYAPRTIDLDIVAWNHTIVDTDYYTRDFVRRSVDEIADGALRENR